jgi:oligoendopeptidase F
VWKDEYNLLMGKIPELSAFKGRLKEGASALADYLVAAEAVQRRVAKVYFYATMSQACDTNDQQANAMAGQAAGLMSKFAATVAFAEPEMLDIGEETLQGWAMAEARLKPYAHYFHNLFRRQAHVRSAEVEQILGMVSEPFSAMEDIPEMLANADLKFADAVGKRGDKFTVAQGTIHTLLSESDREVRRSAWENYADGYLAFKNSFAQSYTASVKRDVFFMRARGYDTALEAALFTHNVPVQVFHNLIKTYRKNLPTWHRYWQIRRKILGVDTLHPYDIWAPLTDKQPEVDYRQAVEWISKGMKPLGKEYVDTLRQGCLKERWVDIYPNDGKRQGAFSYGVPGTYPFIMMSYSDSLGAMSTLAHELGHSMHSYLTWKNQPTVYSRYSMFVAEVASNFNQALTRAYLFKNNKDKDFQIALIEEAMSNFHRYFFIMPTLARFELEVHTRIEKGQGITGDDLIEIMTDYFSEGYGDNMHVDKNRVGITWAQFGHLYVQYYTFQYATGISAAHALADGILAGKKGAADNYRKFLSAGSSLYPVDALKVAGVDMSKPTAVEKTFGVLAEMVDRLEELTK